MRTFFEYYRQIITLIIISMTFVIFGWGMIAWGHVHHYVTGETDEVIQVMGMIFGSLTISAGVGCLALTCYAFYFPHGRHPKEAFEGALLPLSNLLLNGLTFITQKLGDLARRLGC